MLNMMLSTAATFAALSSVVVAGPLPAFALGKRDGACSSYTIINTRGTGAVQGEDYTLTPMINSILNDLPGGTDYATVYPAAQNQDSRSGSADIVNHINSALSSNPNECFVLAGYSQGAAATTDALHSITGDAFDAVKAVFLIGNPRHVPGLACNVDLTGGSSTRNAQGGDSWLWGTWQNGIPGGVPANWVSKTMDVCAPGDQVCNGHGAVTPAHHSYGAALPMGASFLEKALQAGGGSQSAAPVKSTPAPAPAPVAAKPAVAPVASVAPKAVVTTTQAPAAAPTPNVAAKPVIPSPNAQAAAPTPDTPAPAVAPTTTTPAAPVITAAPVQPAVVDTQPGPAVVIVTKVVEEPVVVTRIVTASASETTPATPNMRCFGYASYVCYQQVGDVVQVVGVVDKDGNCEIGSAMPLGSQRCDFD